MLVDDLYINVCNENKLLEWVSALQTLEKKHNFVLIEMIDEKNNMFLFPTYTWHKPDFSFMHFPAKCPRDK